MKILHLADLHIGKKLEGKDRLADQERVLDEICSIAHDEKVDLVLIAGDVFDTPSPSSQAKKLFYKFAISCGGDVPVVAIAGNHDNPDDLTAPHDFAELADVKLVGKAEMLTYDIAGEKVDIFALPYISDARIRSVITDGENFEERMSSYINSNMHFTAGRNNIFLAHLFISGQEEPLDEVSLGPARMLSKSVLPEGCYVALGHIHKHIKVSTAKNAYYAGSPLNYHFGSEKDNEKSVIITTMSKGEINEVRRVPLTSSSKLIVARVNTFSEGIEALETNSDALVKIVYSSANILTSSEVKQFKQYANFVKLELNITATSNANTQRLRELRPHELFGAFYKNKTGDELPKDLCECFLEVMEQIENKGGKL